MTTLNTKLRAAERKLAEAGIETPQIDARWLFGHVLAMDRAELLSNAERVLSNAEQVALDDVIAQREKREPVARIIGAREFWGLNFELNEATLEPRPDSEALIETALKKLEYRRNEPLSLLDLGTGTGCLVLSLLHELPNAAGLGVDLAPRAIEQATQNAVSLGLYERAFFRVSNWLEDVGGQFDVIISNPPYIPSDVIATLQPEVRNHDPHQALDGGEDGLIPYRFLIPRLERFLKPKALVIFEVGFDQAQQVADLFIAQGYADIAIDKDLAGVERCVSGHYLG